MNFIFYSRLEYEKGFDLLIESLRSFETLPGNFFIFSGGGLEKSLFEAFSGNPNFEDCSRWSEEKIRSLSENLPTEPKIYYFSWQSKERIIDRFLSISHFSLVPSRFLETFGLVALESLAVGVPVIGFKK